MSGRWEQGKKTKKKKKNHSHRLTELEKGRLGRALTGTRLETLRAARWRNIVEVSFGGEVVWYQVPGCHWRERGGRELVGDGDLFPSRMDALIIVSQRNSWQLIGYTH